jgi:hypothetical protein
LNLRFGFLKVLMNPIFAETSTPVPNPRATRSC